MPLSADELAQLRRIAHKIRRDLVDVTAWSGGSHIGGSLSMVEMLTILYWKYLNIDPANPGWPDRDRFVLSKGHGGVGHAVVLANRGYFDHALLRDFNQFGAPLGMHLDSKVARGVDVSTGSMGHGLPMAVGLALGARVQKKPWRVFAMVGDGECNEGSIWEAAMAAGHYRLDNLIGFLDRNGLMIDGRTEDIMGLNPVADKWRAFNWETREVDGHDFEQLAAAIDEGLEWRRGPFMIVALTVKGKGVPFMENDPAWHYGGLNAELAAKAKEGMGEE